MNAYIFILCIVDMKEEEIEFHHMPVLADSIDDAYAIGQKTAYSKDLLPVETGKFANDCVIQILEEG